MFTETMLKQQYIVTVVIRIYKQSGCTKGIVLFHLVTMRLKSPLYLSQVKCKIIAKEYKLITALKNA